MFDHLFSPFKVRGLEAVYAVFSHHLVFGLRNFVDLYAHSFKDISGVLQRVVSEARSHYLSADISAAAES